MTTRKTLLVFLLLLICSIAGAEVNWSAKWIGEKECSGPIDLKYGFKTAVKIKRATLFISAKGIYQACLNGTIIGNDLLTPGWTSYSKRIQYQEYDVTRLLRKGANVISATVAPGWYGSGMNWGKVEKRFRYGKDIALICQLEIEYRDGSREVITSNGDWQISPSQVSFAGIYDGQTTDRTLTADWKKVGYVSADGTDRLVASISEPVRRGMPLKAVKYIITPKGEKVIDFGQNISGWERFTIKGNRGDTIRVSHAEIIGPDGNFYTANLRSSKATSTYILSGEQDSFEPVFTFYGFRFIRIEGLDGDPVLEDFEAVPICSDFPKVGSFECSNHVINQLHSNIVWSFRDNYVDIPTDCPQRDERLGWTGDAQVFFRTATFLGNVDKFFRKWLADLALDQRPDGNMPRVIPDTFPRSKSRLGATGWADCATIIPWQHYQAYGNKSILEDQYASMKAWVDWCIREAEPRGWLLNGNLDRHFGDWLSYSLANDPGGLSAVTSKALVAQSFFAASTRILAQSAGILGKTEDRKYYEDVDTKVREAYLNEYVTAGGMVMSDTQTAYVLALHFDLLPDYLKKQAADRLVNNIHRYNDHITTGFLGTPYICEVLTDNGHADLAYKLLLNEDCPGWLYQVLHGATTIWERWDSIKPDGSIIDGMNSFNHYSFGSIGDWLYRCALGIRESSPGYKSIVIRPHAGGGITFMKGSTITPYGKVAAEWTADVNGNIKTLSVEIPSETSAEVWIDGRCEKVGAGAHRFEGGPGTPEEKEIREYNFTDYGIKADGNIQTKAIQALIDKAAGEGGGTLVIPAGTFMTGTIIFRQGVNLRLEEGAVLRGSDDLSDYFLGDTRIEGENCKYFGALIQADGLDGFRISGKGTIDGNGLRFHKAFWMRKKWNPTCTNKDEQRPRLLYIDNCTNTAIEGISLKDSPFWTAHFHNCRHLTLDGLTITSRHKPKSQSGPSTDAIDLDVVENALIKNCTISVNDDGVALKGGKGPFANNPEKCEGNGPNRNIVIENCVFGEATHCCLTIGSESIDSQNITIRNCTANCPKGIFFRYKMRGDTPQQFKNILIENCSGTVQYVFRVQNWKQFYDLKGGSSPIMSYADGFTMRNCNFLCNRFAGLRKEDDYYRLSNFRFENVSVQACEDSSFDTGAIESCITSGLKIETPEIGIQNPLTKDDGTIITTIAQWENRREEILELFQNRMYGRWPDDLEIHLEEIEHGNTTVNGIAAVREQVRMFFTPDHSGPSVDWLIIRPADADGKVPAIMSLNYFGNHAFLPDPQITIPDCWLDDWAEFHIRNNRAQESGRGCLLQTGKKYHYPIGYLLENGFAFVTACYGELSSDPSKTSLQKSMAFNHLFDLWGPRDNRKTDNTMALIAWGWALSKGMDMLEQYSSASIDTSKVMVTGCSRLGKAALLAAAYDKRFAAAAPVQTGSGGMPLTRHRLLGKETIKDETETFTHWFCPNFRDYIDKDSSIPFDQHLLVSCVAPRGILCEGFDNRWFDTKAEYLCLKAASPVWNLYGKTAMPEGNWPSTNKDEAIGSNMGYYHRSGDHGVIMKDWTRIVAFSKELFR